MILLKYWRYGVALLLVLAAAGVFLHYRSVVVERESLRLETERLAGELEYQKQLMQKIQKAGQLKEKKAAKNEKLADPDIVSGLDSDGWLYD